MDELIARYELKVKNLMQSIEGKAVLVIDGREYFLSFPSHMVGHMKDEAMEYLKAVINLRMLQILKKHCL
ncbi:MAG: hypothetical protein AABY15_07025 [Nanoarchaeota archaeon]